MSRLKDIAAEKAGRTETPPAGDWSDVEPGPAAPSAPVEQLPDPGIATPGPEGPEQVPWYVAWSRVMETVRGVSKAERVTEGPAKFNYRGVDSALNVFGPACRLHGVLVLPVKVETSYRDTKTSTGKPTRECTAVVTYRIVGPAGDGIEVQAAGESLDTQDKGTAKAQAVALRTLLYHGGLVPTRDPDPDSVSIERGEAPVRSAASYRDEVLEENPNRARMRQIVYELRQQRRGGELVTNEVGDEEPIGALVERIGRERFMGGGNE